MKEAVVVFVHGLFSSPKTWDPLISLLRTDEEIGEFYDLKPFEYDTPKWKIKPTKRIPDFNIIAASLSTFLEVECSSFRNIILVGHSQGGLIIQRYLAQMLTDGRGRELSRISRVILFACPNSGSEFFMIFRNAIGKFWRQPQERELRPYSDAVTETQRRILRNIIYAKTISSDRCLIIFAVYAGVSDNIVTPASARSVYPRSGALPGDHNSILQADTIEHRTFTTVKANLLSAKEPTQSPVKLSGAESEASLSSNGNFEYRTPLMKVTTTWERYGLTEQREIEIYDQSVAGIYLHQDNASQLYTGEEADSDE